MTDGKWIWLDDIVDYIEQHGLAIPDVWYKEIGKNNFNIPEVSDDQLEMLEWPNL
jgi:hypothetical protein